jgi:transcriptional regulator with XRE-family HTH domain
MPDPQGYRTCDHGGLMTAHSLAKPVALRQGPNVPCGGTDVRRVGCSASREEAMAGDAGTGATDLGRRVVEQREKEGLSREDVAERAGMSESYLAYLETSSDSNPTHATLARLAAALDVELRTFSGAAMNLPPGQRGAASSPMLEELTADECRAYIAAGGVGRFLFDDEIRGPVAVPVNYKMDADDVVFRTDSKNLLTEGARHQQVAFDVDHLDETLAEGWSVLLSGSARVIRDPGELERAKALAIQPWAGAHLDTYVRLVPAQITGRRIRVTG